MRAALDEAECLLVLGAAGAAGEAAALAHIAAVDPASAGVELTQARARLTARRRRAHAASPGSWWEAARPPHQPYAGDPGAGLLALDGGSAAGARAHALSKP
jgi:hypothetical protein